jgi:hypothetical protein
MKGVFRPQIHRKRSLDFFRPNDNLVFRAIRWEICHITGEIFAALKRQNLNTAEPHTGWGVWKCILAEGASNEVGDSTSS